MKITDLTEDGRIVKGVNTTPDVQPGETERQAKKLFPMNKNGKPQSLGVPGASPNVAFNLGLTEDELTTVQRAEQFAQQAHKDHQRKYTGDPYYVHLDEVRRIVKGAGGSEDMQVAALLHDTVEDTSVTSQDIMKEFGPRIAKLVVELTDVSKPEDGNRAVRKGIDRDKLAGVSAEAQTIKYADLISNGKDIVQNDPKFAKVYMKEKADLLRVMTKGDSRLRSAALAMLPDELKENMSVTGTERRRLEKKKGLEIGSPEWFEHWFELPYLKKSKKNLKEDASPIQKVDIAQLEKFADRLFGKVGIDVEFTRHFMDRVNDVRNQKPITMSELTRLFKQEYKRWGKPIAQMGPDSQAVMKDLQTDINLPFVLKWDDKNMELDLIAKTVMRKADFKTPNKEFPVESVPMPVTKKDAALQKQAQHMVMKSKIDQKPNVDMMQITNKAMRDHVKGIGQDADKLSKAAGIPRDAVKPPKPLTQRSGNFTKFSKNPFVENVPTTNQPGTFGHKINWANKNKPQQDKKFATRGTQNPQSWWQSMLQKGKNLFDDEQLDLKKKFEITPELQQLNSIFKKGKHEIRIVGGAVRDLALGKSPKDIDLATDATPKEMMDMLGKAGIKHIPTGIEHGTITAVVNNEPYEITTLRADTETDGRRATVQFVRSWEEDAKRRDLTYNAMSMDFDGNLYDYHGGMDDLQDKVTKFVGDPEERIKEDYLRTLRYFRFQGRLDTPTFDRTTMNAIASNTDGLKQLSVERVWMEMSKILGGGNLQSILGAMKSTGVLDAIGLKYKPSNDLMDGGDPIINLARITDEEAIGLRWKMSNEEKSKLGFLISEKGKTHDKKWYTDMMADGFDRTQLDALARYNNQDDMINYVSKFKAPEFPVDGNDLIKMGHERGPKIGQTLQALRNQWKAGNFSASKEELLKSINEEGPFGVLARKAGHLINKSQYMKAAEILHKILKRKYKENDGKIRHSLGYYAQMIGNQTGNKINWRELEQEYLNMYGNAMFENFADGKVKGKSRPGRVKRAGASCDGSVTSLRKKAKNSSGEKAKMYHWCANMKSGKKKK